jgi:DNA-binding transcriptional ArsR family regulator
VTAPHHQPTNPSALQRMLDALSSPVRREILWMVWDAELAAGDIAAAFDVTAPTISSHLAVLRAAGLVEMRVDGNFRRYQANREAMQAVVPLLAADDAKWQAADDLPELALAHASVEQWVTVTARVDGLDVQRAFEAFTDGDQFSDWLGVPVAITDGRFSAQLEWGTTVRGHYEVMVPPVLIALRWDFDDDAIPVPGRQLVGYVRFFDEPAGCRIEVHQHALDAGQAAFLSTAWSMVLGRLKEYVEQPPPGPGPHRRPPRPKRSTGMIDPSQDAGSAAG